MKKVVIGLLIVLLIGFASALSNPSAVYCEELGYTYNLEHESCKVSERIELNAWDFFEGKIGQEYSYCAKKGYSIKTMDDGNNSFSSEYAVCGVKFTKGIFGKTEFKTMSDMMNLSLEDFHELPAATETGKDILGDAPSSFDWRNYNMTTSVKNQASCGSCWAFAAVGGMEAKIEIERNDTIFDADLSEQDLVSCGVPLGYYGGHDGGCDGASLDDPLNYIRDTGITDEECFSYTATDSACTEKCNSSSRRNWKINNWTAISSSQMKSYLVERGPLVASLDVSDATWDNGIARCSILNYSDHALVIVGYNDTGQYWILKNSWGNTWNGDGYFKMGYGECNIEDDVYSIGWSFEPATKVIVNNVSGNWTGNYSDFNSKDSVSAFYNGNATTLFFANLSKIVGIDVIAYQNSTGANLTFYNSGTWTSLGVISQLPYLIKYNLCNSFSQCNTLLSSSKNITLRYGNATSIDLLYIDSRLNCSDNWTANSTWTACNISDRQTSSYYDSNFCYSNTTLNNTIAERNCDFCVPNWTEIKTCNGDESFSWYNDTNSCFEITNLSSDLIGRSENLTNATGCTVVEVVAAPSSSSSSGGGSSSGSSGGGGGSSSGSLTAAATNVIANTTNEEIEEENSGGNIATGNEKSSEEEKPNESAKTSSILGIAKNSVSGFLKFAKKNNIIIFVFAIALFGAGAFLLLRKKKAPAKEEIIFAKKEMPMKKPVKKKEKKIISEKRIYDIRKKYIQRELSSLKRKKN
jgi:C1A family cysteine protease/putative hemolysin